jgi:hypothetical protein
MNFAAVEKIANAVLYEGYILYPYRASSTKNRQRWNFGTLYPRQYAEAQRPAEHFRMISECLIKAAADAKLDIRIRFLQLVESNGDSDGSEQGWQQGVDRAKDFAALRLDELLSNPKTLEFRFATGDSSANARNLLGELKLSATTLPEGPIKLRLELINVTHVPAALASRNQALLQSFTSAHVLLGIVGGEFISLLDPPEAFRSAVSTCENVGAFPVLAGDEGQRSIMFCAPIILYDYPQVAPESAGDFFDGTEMDEMLALRVLTLTDDEKREMLQDDRSRKILERTESLPSEHLMKVHGAIRGLRRIQDENGEQENVQGENS